LFEIHLFIYLFEYVFFRTNNDNSHTKNSTRHLQSKVNNSHELMQGNYYDKHRYIDYSSTNHQSRPVPIDINLEDYKKVKIYLKSFFFLINTTLYKQSNLYA
jgi:hypothetical protein